MDSSSHRRESRIARSSSTTKTSGWGSGGMAISLTGGQDHVEGGAARRIRRGPELPAVRFDDRAADVETKAESVALGGEERLEEPARRGLGHARASVSDDQLDGGRIARTRLDPQLAPHAP